MTDSTTTTRVRSAPLSQPDEVQVAQNVFAIAVKNFRLDPTEENRVIMEKAENHLLQVHESYRQGRWSRLEFVREQLRKLTGRRS